MIEPRYTELLNLVNEEILQLQEKLRQQGVKHHLAAGIVLTGGAAQIEGLAACAQRVFHTQVRIGAPLNITGLTDYAQDRIIRRRWDCFTMGKSHILTVKLK